MKERLINHVSLTRRLRQLLVLFTLLLTSQVTWAEDYVFVSGTTITDENYANGLFDGKVTFTPASGDNRMKLTLNGFDMTCGDGTGRITICGQHDLEIELAEDSKNTMYLINSQNTANKLSFSGDGTLAINGSSYVISNIDEIDLGDFNLASSSIGVHNSNGNFYDADNHVVKDVILTKATVYQLWVGGVQVTDDNSNNVLGDGTVFYDGTFLYLENAEINGDIIYNGEFNTLYINIIGANTVNRITYIGQEEVTLYVMKANEQPGSRSLTVTGNGTDAAISGFISECITGNDYYDSDRQLYWKPTVTNNVMTSLLVTTDVFGGTGTEASPYIISTPLQLKLFATMFNDNELAENCYVKLGGVIDCTGLENFVPIGTSDIPFKGTFDGMSTEPNNWYIANLSHSAGSNDFENGLFAVIDGGTVQNLKLAGCTFSGGDEVGAIVGHLTSGTINNCQVATSTLSSHNDVQTENVGGVAGVVENGTISNCSVFATSVTSLTTYSLESGSSNAGGIVGLINCSDGTVSISSNTVAKGEGSTPTTILSSHGHPSYACAGGIVGQCTGEGTTGITISGNKVKDDTAVNSIDGNASENLYSGAIVGFKANATLSDNVYYYTVTTSTTNGGEATAVTRDGYNERGTGTENTVVSGSYDLTDNDGAVLYTKELTIVHDHIKEGYKPTEWHTGFSTDGGVFHLIPGLETTVTLEPDEYYSITAASLSYGTTPTVESLDGVLEDGVYSYTFTMPDNDATLTPTMDLPGYLGLTVAGVPVTETNASNVLDDVHASVSYSDGTLTLNGATIDGKITYNGTSNLTIAFSGTNSVTTSESSAIQYTGSESDRPKLTFSSTNGTLTINGESIKGFSDVDFGSLNLASISAQGVYYDKEYFVMSGRDTTPSDLTITTETYYPIWIYDPSLSNTGRSHTQLRGESTITIGDGSVSFNGNDTVTISNIYFNPEGNTLIVVGPSMTELTVNLVGQSTATSGCTVLSLWDTTPLTFTTDASTPGSLTGYDIVLWNNFGNGQISYENGLGLFYDAENSNKETISTTGTYFKIGDTEVSATGDITIAEGTAHFDASSKTLTLTDVTIGEQGAAESTDIQVLVDNLIIEISGTNTIYGNITYNGSNYQSSNIQINKASNAESASLKVTNVEGFTSCTWGDGLYLSAQDAQGATIDVHYEHYEGDGGSMQSYYGEGIADVTFSTTPSNAIWVAGNMVTETGNVEGTGINSDPGSVYYDAENHKLTLDNASIFTNAEEPSPLIVCNGNLTVDLVGPSSLCYNSGNTYAFKNIGSTGELTFTSTSTSSEYGNYLSITSECNEGTYKGLCDGFTKVNFNNDLGLFNQSGSKRIGDIDGAAPIFDLNNSPSGYCYLSLNSGLLLNATYHYTIDYVDSSGVEVDLPIDETNHNLRNVSLSISDLAGPCTITAYAKLDGDIISRNKAKLFGYTEPLTITYNGTAFELTTADLPAIFPAIEEGDDVTYQIAGVSQGNAVTYDEQTQKYMVQGIGTAVLNINLMQGDNTPYQVLNEVASLTVNVVAALDIEFVDDNSWASYYATENLTVPTGLTAYVVSDVDEESGAVTVTSIGYIPKNNAVLLEREQNGAASGYTAGAYTGTTTTVNNLLSGSPNTTDISSLGSGPVYVLFNDKFKRAINGTIPARRAYLALNAAVAPVSAPQYLTISIVDGNSTAIDTLTVDDNSNDSWYSIDGLKLKGKPQRKGLYINNGKKVYINNNK